MAVRGSMRLSRDWASGWANTGWPDSCAGKAFAPRPSSRGGPPRTRPILIQRRLTRSTVSSPWPRPTACGPATSRISGPQKAGCIWLAVVLDLYSRMAIAWAMGSRLTETLATEALTMALGRRHPVGELLHHSDRGSQYAALLYRELLASHGITVSMSSRGNCWDNAVVEGFMHTLKTALGAHRCYMTRAEANQDIFEWLEVFYNRTRRHSTLGYRSPAEFEAMARRS